MSLLGGDLFVRDGLDQEATFDRQVGLVGDEVLGFVALSFLFAGTVIDIIREIVAVLARTLSHEIDLNLCENEEDEQYNVLDFSEYRARH